MWFPTNDIVSDEALQMGFVTSPISVWSGSHYSVATVWMWLERGLGFGLLGVVNFGEISLWWSGSRGTDSRD